MTLIIIQNVAVTLNKSIYITKICVVVCSQYKCELDYFAILCLLPKANVIISRHGCVHL